MFVLCSSTFQVSETLLCRHIVSPIGSMYGIYANIWGVLMVNVTIYTIHGSYGSYGSCSNLFIPWNRAGMDRWWQVDDGYISKPELIEFPTANGETAYGFYYPPSNCDFEAPEGPEGEAGAPPLLVKAHGGPTAQTSIVFNPALQFWTSRGFAVLPGGEGYISFFHPGNSRDGFSTYVLRMSFSLYLEVFLFECPGHELSCSQISRVSTTDFIFQAELQWRSQRFLDDFWAWHVAKSFADKAGHGLCGEINGLPTLIMSFLPNGFRYSLFFHARWCPCHKFVYNGW